MQEHSVSVNRRATSGNFTLEVLSSVAIAGAPTPSVIIDRATGQTSYDWENTTMELEAFTFFSLEDRTGNVEFSPEIMLDRTFEPTTWDPAQQVSLWANMPIFSHSHEGRGYFVVTHRGSAVGNVNRVNLDIGVNYIIGDIQSNVTSLDIDLYDILQNHTANFNRRANDMFGFPVLDVAAVSPPPPRDWQGHEIPRYIYVTERGQLNIPLYGDRYLTNLAIRDGRLHVQTSEPDPQLDMAILLSSRWSPFRWMENTHVSLRDTRIDWDVFSYPNNLTPEELEAAIQEMSELHQQFMMVNSADLSIVNMTTGRTVGGRRYSEEIYEIAGSHVVEHLEFFVTSNTIGLSETVDLTVQSFNVPVINQHRQIDGGAGIVLTSGERVTVNDISLSPLGMTISIDMRHDTLLQFFAQDSFEVYLIDARGTETPFTWRFASTSIDPSHHMGGTWGFVTDRMPAMGDTVRARINLAGNAIDVENVARVRINGIVF